jgi:hypothetical protein
LATLAIAYLAMRAVIEVPIRKGFCFHSVDEVTAERLAADRKLYIKSN